VTNLHILGLQANIMINSSSEYRFHLKSQIHFMARTGATLAFIHISTNTCNIMIKIYNQITLKICTQYITCKKVTRMNTIHSVPIK
jgi:hypothetical protein